MFLVRFVLLFLATCSAHAAITGEDYAALANDPARREAVRAYVNGVGAAYESLDVDIKIHKKGARLYCQPESLVMREQNYIDILEARLREIAQMKRDMPFMKDYVAIIEPELLRGLQKTFPCTK